MFFCNECPWCYNLACLNQTSEKIHLTFLKSLMTDWLEQASQ